MKIKSIIILVFLLFNVKAFSQNWIYVGSATNGNKYYLRSNNTSGTSYKKVWSKTVGKSIQYKKNGKIYTLLDGYSIDLHEYDCSERQIKLLSYVYYSSKGTPVHSVTIQSFDTEWWDVTPDSIGEMLLDKVCELF
jgi:hypothetical protein